MENKIPTSLDWLLERFNNYDISTGKAGFRRLIHEAKQKDKNIFTEDDVRKAIEIADDDLGLTADEIIEQLKQSKNET